MEKGHGRVPWEGKGHGQAPWEGKGHGQAPWEGKGSVEKGHGQAPWVREGVVRAQERVEGSPPEVRAIPRAPRGLGSPVEGVLLEESPVVEEVDV